MKLITGIVTSLVIGSLSFGAFAAKEIQKDEVASMKLTKIGSITTSKTTSPMDAKRDLSKKADELGGKYFVVIAGSKNEKTVHANADVYK
ncbi:TPA: YdgH/BhsA/McbA-like domain containing protein [Raoultella ornithinolytica]